jgi:phospholipid/cholesterol/gamma-HCH transport system substrate-binding protein
LRGLSTEVKVGLAVLLGAVLLTYMTFAVGGFRFREGGYRLFAVFDSTAGLDKKSPVRVAGVEVGRVDEISLVDSHAKVEFRIKPDVPLKKGTQAAIRSTGLLGDKYVELIPGKGPALLKDGETIGTIQQPADLEQLMSRFGAIADDIKAVTASLREALGTEVGQQSLKEIVANIRELSGGISDFVRDNRQALGKTVSNLEAFSRALKDQGDQIMTSLGEITRKVSKGEGTLGKLVNDDQVYNKLNRSLDDLGDSLKSINTVTAKVERGEGTIGKLFTDEKAYERLNTALEGLSNAVSRIDRFRVTLGFRGEHQLYNGQNKGYFSLVLQPREDKYYLVEIIDDPRGRVTKTVNQVTVGGVPNPTVEDIKIERRLKFTVQFGKRISELGLRIGLEENSFGVGADYYLFNDALRLSYDAWDFNSDDPEGQRTHMKAMATYTFLKYLSVNAGYDNFLNKKLDTFFFGAGLRFDDDDLKYLIGSAATLIR